jgi:hypothetical protein
MLQDFLTLYPDAIINKTRESVAARTSPPASTRELEQGIPLFLTQLSDTIGTEMAGRQAPDVIGQSATRHGGELFALGFTLSQVVHDYGDVCQAVTQLAVELKAPIAAEEFHILNRSLDTAIANAVTEHGRITAANRGGEEQERLARLASELKAVLNTAVAAFEILKSGTVAVNGSTGAILGKSLVGAIDLLDATLAEARLAANRQAYDDAPAASDRHE